MKKFTLLFLISATIFTITSNAQIKKGSVFLGGDIGGSAQTTKRNGTKVNSQEGLTISPVFGKAIKENLIVGGDANIGFFTNDNNPASGSFTGQKNNSYGAGIFIRKYKPIGKSSFSMFLQGRFGVNYNSNEYTGSSSSFDKTKRYTIGVFAYPGISYTVSKKLQLETGFNNLFGLSYFTEERELSSGSPYIEKTNGVNISSSLNNISSLYLGFRVLIGK
jgi:hypothetical protein